MISLLSRTSKLSFSCSNYRCWSVHGEIIRRSINVYIDPDDTAKDIRKRMRHVENEPKPSGDSVIRTKPFTRQERRAKYVRVIRKKWDGNYITASTTIMAKSGRQFRAGKNVAWDVKANLLYAITSGTVQFRPAPFLSKIGGYIVSIKVEDPDYPIPELKHYQDYVFGPPKPDRARH